MPKFVIDEDMPRSTARALMEEGFAVKNVRDHGYRGSSDAEIYRFAQEEGAILLTGDLGFSNILKFPQPVRPAISGTCPPTPGANESNQDGNDVIGEQLEIKRKIYTQKTQIRAIRAIRAKKIRVAERWQDRLLKSIKCA